MKFRLFFSLAHFSWLIDLHLILIQIWITRWKRAKRKQQSTGT